MGGRGGGRRAIGVLARLNSRGTVVAAVVVDRLRGGLRCTLLRFAAEMLVLVVTVVVVVVMPARACATGLSMKEPTCPSPVGA